MIEFLMTNWVLFLIVAVVGVALAIITQLINMAKLHNGDDSAMFARFGVALFFMAIGCIGWFALLASVAFHAIEHFSS